MTTRHPLSLLAGVILALALVAGLAGRVTAATYYVDAGNPKADDSHGGSEAAPWKTLARAVTGLASGDVVVVRPGQYDEVVTVKVSGTESGLITLRAEPSRKARVRGFVLLGDYLSIEGFEVAGGNDQGHGIFAGEGYRKTARTGCRILDNFIHDLAGTAIFTGEKALVKGNLMRNVFRGVFANSGTLVEGNEIDTLTPVMEEKDGQKKPKKTQYTFFSGDDITFRGNHLHGAPEEHLISGMGVCFFASWDAWIFPSSHRILIENNRCFNATHASEPMGTEKKDSSHITYRNNLFVNTVYVGVMPKGFTHVTVENNTFINCGAYPVWLQGPQCETAVVRNNLIAYIGRDRVVNEFGWKEPDAGIRFDTQGARPQCDYNMLFGTENRKYGQRDVIAEPQFVDPDRGDFRLRPNSPGIDAGVTIEAVGTDLRGVKRPQGRAYDVGCYETEAASPAADASGKEDAK
ncbi:MAG TPA: right-handed parallel beta-helix repeat-containing protein [Phycisphaerae bacterium]|nr:right-handed parallel beta-helix repeat-containing protein [Phycisphaerae bacterium]